RLRLLRGAEETKQAPVGLEERRECGGERLRRRTIEIIEHVPAQDSINGARRFLETLREELRQLLGDVVLDVMIDVFRDVLDAQSLLGLALLLLALLRRVRLLALLRLLLRRLRGAALALHVDAAAEMCALGDRDPG